MPFPWKVWVTAGWAALAVAQTPPRPHFDVAAIKLHITGGNLVRVRPQPGGRLIVENAPLRSLIETAYGIQDYQLSDGPRWLLSDRYDIQAKAEGIVPAKQTAGPMLQALLEDRFRLKVHREIRQLPVYELAISRRGAKLPRARPGGCLTYNPDLPLPPMPAPGQRAPVFCGFRGFGFDGPNRTLEMAGVTMAELAASLSAGELRTRIIDKTGLAGTFDVHLKWIADPVSATAVHAQVVPGPPPPPVDTNGPSLLSAIQEQLGLKLEPAKGPVDVLVIDHLESPSAN